MSFSISLHVVVLGLLVCGSGVVRGQEHPTDAAPETSAPGPLPGSVEPSAPRAPSAPGAGGTARPLLTSALPGAEPPALGSPSLAVGSDGTVLAVFAAEDEIYGVLSRDGGEHFGPPQRIGSAGRLESGPVRGPRAAITPDALIVAAICGETLRGQDGNLLVWRSEDRGLNWKGPLRVNDSLDAAREGLFALAASPEGELVATWLDLRTGQTELWGAWSSDGGRSWSRNAPFYASPDGSICECCPPAVRFDPSRPGEAVVLWRNALGGNRDMYTLVVSRDGTPTAGAARRLDSRHWELQGCPVSGGDVAISSEGLSLYIWRREGDLFTAAPGLGEVRLGAGREVAAVSGPQGFHLAWTDGAGEVFTALSRTLGGGLSSRALGRGLNLSLAGAPDGLGPVLAVWETGEGGPDSLRHALLAPRSDTTDP